MTLNEATGIRAYKDIRDGHEVSHEEQMERYIEYLGGEEAIIPYLPFTDPKFLADKLYEDCHLNNTKMVAWDYAAGFVERGMECTPTGGGLWRLYNQHGITAESCATSVCILKHVAKKIGEKELVKRGITTKYLIMVDRGNGFKPEETAYSKAKAENILDKYKTAFMLGRCSAKIEAVPMEAV